MMKKIYAIALVLLTACSYISFAQSADGKGAGSAVNAVSDTTNKLRPDAKVEMADILYQNGKIYLVVLVLLTIFAGIIFYLVRLDRKLSRLENQN
jgi:hypothetical protein